MQGLRILSCALWLMLLQSCATPEPGVPGWPADLPDSSYFIAAWEADTANQQLQERDDYLLWVQRFYHGFNLAPGWQSMQKQLLDRLDAPQAASVRARLDELGLRIGREWAKHNDVRRINTRMAATWREALQEALSQDDLPRFLDMFEADVRSLLSGELEGSAIAFERYYVDEFDF